MFFRKIILQFKEYSKIDNAKGHSPLVTKTWQPTYSLLLGLQGQGYEL